MPGALGGNAIIHLLQIKSSHPIASSKMSSSKSAVAVSLRTECVVYPCCSQGASVSFQSSFLLGPFPPRSDWAPQGQLVLGSGVHGNDTEELGQCD